MLAIKLQRIGKKHQPSYRIIVQEKREKLGGRCAEDIGWFNPLLDKREVKADRLNHWLKVGAQPTPTVHNLLVSAGLISGAKIPVHKKPKPATATAAAAPAAPALPQKAAEEPKPA